MKVPVFNEMSMIKTVVLSVMFVVSLVGNTATLLQMYRKRRRRSTINTLILHLATADLIVTFFCNVTDAVWASTVQWYAGNAMCKLVKFVQVFGLYLSTYIIVIISIDRCLAILDPMSRNKAPRRVRAMIAVAWILSFLFSLPQVGGRGSPPSLYVVSKSSKRGSILGVCLAPPPVSPNILVDINPPPYTHARARAHTHTHTHTHKYSTASDLYACHMLSLSLVASVTVR